MKIPNLPTLRLSGPAAPEDAAKIADWLAPVIEQVQILTQALQKYASLPDNLNIELQKVPFKQSTEIVVSTKVKSGIAGVIVIDSEDRSQPFPDPTFRRVSNTKLGLTMTWATDPGAFKEVSFLVVGL